MAVVSWPARKRVITSSRNCASLHGIAVRVPHLKQHVQKIFARLIGRTPLSDDAPDDLIQFADGPPFPRRKKTGISKRNSIARLALTINLSVTLPWPCRPAQQQR